MKHESVRYHWVKTSVISLAFFAIWEFGVLLWGSFYGYSVALWFALFGAVFVLGLFYSMQVTVFKDSLYIAWGVGLFSKEVGFGEIADFKILKNKVLSAYIYNPQAEHVLEVRLRSDKLLYLPCDQAKKLMDILKVPL